MVSDYAEGVAKIFDYSPDLIQEILDISDKKKIIFHGSKNGSLEDFLKYGVESRTPENGYTSFWSTSKDLFGSGNPSEDIMYTLDSPFFNYAHNRNASDDKTKMLLILCDMNTIVRLGIENTNPYGKSVIIKDNVPSGYIHPILVESNHRFKSKSEEISKITERKLADSLLKVLKNYSQKENIVSCTVETYPI